MITRTRISRGFHHEMRRWGVWSVLLLAPIILQVVPGQARALDITFTPTALTIHPGERDVPLQVDVSAGDYTGPISIALSGLPSGITAEPLVLTQGESGTLMLNASPAADWESFTGAAEQVGKVSVSHTIEAVAAKGAAQARTPLSLTVSISDPSFAPEPGSLDLPVVRVDTDGTEIPKEKVKIPETITITSSDGRTTYLSDTGGTIWTRGNSTREMPKRSYSIKLGKSADVLHLMGLECPYVTREDKKPTCAKKKQYALLANFADKTMLRHWAASKLANSIPIGGDYLDSRPDSPTPSGTDELMPWAPHSLFVELYINGEYQGVYQLVEKIKLDDNRVNINEQKDHPDETGGYLLEIDIADKQTSHFVTPRGVHIGIREPDEAEDQLTQIQLQNAIFYIRNYVGSAEYALFASNYTDPDKGWRAYFDEASVVNFYLVLDAMGNNDGGAMQGSDYIYKDKDNPLLYMGPVWDFDVSSGNANFAAISDPTIPWVRERAVWYRQWFTDPGFAADVARQFNTLKANHVFDDWLDAIHQKAEKLEKALQNNYSRWPTLGVRVWPNPQAAGSYRGEVDYLLTYLKLRLAYLDSVFNSKTATTTTLSAPGETATAGVPLTLMANVVTHSEAPTGTVTFLLQNGEYPFVGPTAPVGGDGAATATVERLQPGSYQVFAVYSGDADSGLSVSDPVSIEVSAPPAPTVTSIAFTDDADVSSGFTASVIGTSGTNDPTGTLTFTANGEVLGTVTLVNGAATFVPGSLLPESQVVQASYSGDSHYQPSESPELKKAVPGFSLKTDPAQVDVRRGEAASMHVTVAPEGGYNGRVSFSCSGLPAGSHCSFSPPEVTVSGGAVGSTLTIATDDVAAAGAWTGSAVGWVGVFPLGSGLLLMLLPPLRRGRRTRTAIIICAAMVGIALSACNSGSQSQPPPSHGSQPPPPDGSQPLSQTYRVTVTASDTTVARSTIVSLTIRDY